MQDAQDMQVLRLRISHGTHDKAVVHDMITIHVIAAPHYIVHDTVGRNARVVLPITMVLDTGPTYNVRQVMPCTQNWQAHRLQYASLPNLGDTNRSPLSLQHAVRQRFRIGKRPVLHVLLCGGLPLLPVLVGTQFMSRTIEAFW